MLGGCEGRSGIEMFEPKIKTIGASRLLLQTSLLPSPIGENSSTRSNCRGRNLTAFESEILRTLLPSLLPFSNQDPESSFHQHGTYHPRVRCYPFRHGESRSHLSVAVVDGDFGGKGREVELESRSRSSPARSNLLLSPVPSTFLPFPQQEVSLLDSS